VSVLRVGAASFVEDSLLVVDCLLRTCAYTDDEFLLKLFINRDVALRVDGFISPAVIIILMQNS